MAVSAHDLLHAFRRFVALRSAWRRSLALEPAPPPAPAHAPDPGSEAGGCRAGGCCA